MIIYLLSFFLSFLLGILLVLIDFFPDRSLHISNILTYLSYQNTSFLDFEIEQKLFGYACLVSFIIFTVISFIPFLFPIKNRKLIKTFCPIILLLFILVKLETSLSISTFIQQNLKTTMLYEHEYKTPFVSSSFLPETKKKNLIVLMLESLEDIYSSQELFHKNLIPYLSNLEGIKMNQYQEILGLDNTSSSLIGLFCGLPYIPSLKEIDRNKYSFLFSNNVCLSDILSKAGYQIFFYTATDTRFAHKNLFLKTHHVHQIEDAQTLRRSEKDNGLSLFKAVKDSVLFDAALNKIRYLSKNKKPFAFFILTLNMHELEGFFEKQCKFNSSEKFKNVIACSDFQTKYFFEELKKIPSFKDTLIILIGDHLARKNELYNILEKQHNRTIYNRFINTKPFPSTDRTFTAMDIGPTILELLGFQLHDGALGLGRSLLRPEQTLIEKLGKKKLEEELLKKSKKYNSFLKK